MRTPLTPKQLESFRKHMKNWEHEMAEEAPKENTFDHAAREAGFTSDQIEFMKQFLALADHSHLTTQRIGGFGVGGVS